MTGSLTWLLAARRLQEALNNRRSGTVSESEQRWRDAGGCCADRLSDCASRPAPHGGQIEGTQLPQQSPVSPIRTRRSNS
jgi:hypothetical protein